MQHSISDHLIRCQLCMLYMQLQRINSDWTHIVHRGNADLNS